MQEIPADVHDFILRHLDSIAQLEALLLLRENPNQDWSSQDLAARLYISSERAESLLLLMKSEGFVEATNDRFWYLGGTKEQKAIIDRLAKFYTSHLVAVTNLIHSRPSRIREFANAFRLKKD
jgi:hypothetical protein